MLYLILIFCLLFAGLAYKRPAWTIYLIAALLPGYLIRASLFGLPFTLLEAMILILFLMFLLKNKFSWLKNFYRNHFFWPTIVFLAAATLSFLISPNLRAAAGIWKAYFLEPILFFIVLISTLKTTKEIKNIFWALGFSAVSLSLIALGQKIGLAGLAALVPPQFLKPTGAVDRVTSILGYPNALGLYLSPIIILFVGFLFWEKKIFLNILKIIVIVLSFTTIVLAKSEAAFLALLIVGLLYLLSRKKTLIWGVLIVIILLGVFFALPQINQYLTNKLLLQDYSGFIRRLIWQESWQMLKDHWFFGAGLAGYQTQIAPYHLPTFEIFLYPHNIILNFWSELGLIGLLAFLWLIIKYSAFNLKNLITNKFSWVFLAIILQFIIHGLVDAPYFRNDLAVLFWLIVALPLIFIKAKKSNGEND